jgi:hypothetical protein
MPLKRHLYLKKSDTKGTYTITIHTSSLLLAGGVYIFFRILAQNAKLALNILQLLLFKPF